MFAAGIERKPRDRDCDFIIEQERAMAETIAANWEKFAELSLSEAGVPVP